MNFPCRHCTLASTAGCVYSGLHLSRISKQSDLLQQVALIESEIKDMLKDAPTEGNYYQVPTNNSNQSTTETQHTILLTPQ